MQKLSGGPLSGVRLGKVEVDLEYLIVRRGAQRTPLTRQESRILRILLHNRGFPVGREELLLAAWGKPPDKTTRKADWWIGELRKKIEEDPRHPRHIITVRGIGYQLNID